MAKWVRALIREEGTSARWHALAAEKEYAVASALCGERLTYAVESATSDERIARDGRCPACEAAVASRQKEATPTPR
jgi:hypothetical protein